MWTSGAMHDAAAAWSGRLEAMLESTGNGFYGIDLSGGCTFFNRAGAQMLQRSTEEVLGRNLHVPIRHSHPDGRGHFDATVAIDSVPGRGTTVRLTMPLPPDEGAP